MANVIYRPGGPALEYSAWGLNLVKSSIFETIRSCSVSCLYCYNGCGKENLQPGPTLKDNLLYDIEHQLPRLKRRIKPNERVHLTFVGELYDPEIPPIQRDILGLFGKYEVPFQILTKCGTKAVGDFDLYFKGCRFGSTLTFDNTISSKQWEPNAALPQDRIKALRIAHESVIDTWVSLEPVIDPVQSLHLIDLTCEFVDFYGVGKLNHHPEIENSIDWHKYRVDAETKLIDYGNKYKIKQALKVV